MGTVKKTSAPPRARRPKRQAEHELEAPGEGEPDAGKRGRGRPSKLTAAVMKKIATTLKAGNYRVTAARAAGVSYESFALWFGKGKTARSGPMRDFYEAVIAAETAAETDMVKIITREARLDAKHAKWFLSHRFRERWADNLSQGKIEVSGPNGKPVQIEGARERLLARLDQLAARRQSAKTEGA